MNQNSETASPPLGKGQSPATAGAGTFAWRRAWLKRIYGGGLVIFLLSRFLGIWGGYFTGETARNGGDAMTYLWHARNCMLGYPTNLPSVQSAKQQLAENHSQFGVDGEFPLFIHARLQGSATPLFDLVLGSMHALVRDDGLAYALVETLTALIVAAGAGCVLRRLAGRRAAGLALLAMSVIILPRQGIDTMIASLAATGLTLWMSGALLRVGRPSWGWIATGAICLSLVHAIGIVFLAYLGALAAVISWRRREPLLKGRAACFAVIAAIAVGLRLIAYKLVPGMNIANEYHSAAHTLSHVGENAERSVRFIYDMLRKNLAVLLLLLVAAGSLRRRFFTPRVCWVLMAWGLASLATFLHHLPGYKADLFGRVLVISAFVLCGVAARAWFHRSHPWWLRAAVCAFFAMQVTRWVGTQMGEQMHFNWYAFDLNRTGEVLKQHKPAEKLLVVEGEQSLQAAMLAGGENREVIWMPAYAKEPQPWKVAMEQSDWLGIVAPPRELNCLAMIRPQGFSRMRLGVSFDACSAIQVEAQDHRALPALTLTFLSAEELSQVLFVPYDNEGGRMTIDVLTIKQSSSGLEWTVSGSGVHRLDIMLPEGSNWLVGLREPATNAGLHWPWNSGLNMRYAARNVRASPMYTVDFNLHHALKLQASVNLPPPPFAITPLDDSAGLIFYQRQTPR
ncbi:hypothetical protein [Prosthecobacter sp.]|uniref:hypothetical protein n=1 Tax=Prosthecobacter sp. TaxID=1965333 RepID=UPI003783FAA5